MKGIKLARKIKFKRIITRFMASATAFSMSALVLVINSKAASQEPDVKISCNSYRFLMKKLSLDENNTFTRRLNDEKVLSFFDNSGCCENCSTNGSEHEKCDGGGTAMPSYLFETTDIPMFSVTQGGKEMKFSEVSVTQNDVPKDIFNVKVVEINKQKNLFSVEIETKSSKPVTVTESNVPIGYQPLNPSVTVNAYDMVGMSNIPVTYPFKVAFTKSFVGDNGGFMQAVDRAAAQTGDNTFKLLQNLFISSNPLFTLGRKKIGSTGEFAQLKLSADSVQITAHSTIPVNNITGFTAIIDVPYESNYEFIISENMNLLSGLYISSGNACFSLPKIGFVNSYNYNTKVKLPFDAESTLGIKFGTDVFVLLPKGTTLGEKTFDAAHYAFVNDI